MSRAAWLALVLLGCSAAPVQPTRDLARERAEAAARDTQRAMRQREIERQAARHALTQARQVCVPALRRLQDWDQAGDTQSEQVADLVAAADVVRQVGDLAQMCQSRLPALSGDDGPQAQPVRAACRLAERAHGILMRQFRAAARQALAFSDSLAEVPLRYHQEGRVTWDQLVAFDRLDADIALRRAEIALLGPAWLSELPLDVFAPALRAKAQLLKEISSRQAELDLPRGKPDAALDKLVRRLLPALAAQGPFPGQREAVLEVRALDPQWQSFLGARGEVVRRTRDVALRVRITGRPDCVGLWARVEQFKKPRQKETLRLDHDVRMLRCQPPGPLNEVERVPWQT